MSDDRELLELAAKAAEIEYKLGSHGAILELFADGHAEWNPLTDDGDALRLAVKLNIHLASGKQAVTAYIPYPYPERDLEVFELVKSDPYAATRRAIVRAAAEIGRSMKDE